MIVKELIEKLKDMPQDSVVIMFDGPAYYTPSQVYVAENFKSKRIYGKVIID